MYISKNVGWEATVGGDIWLGSLLGQEEVKYSLKDP